MCGIIGYVGKQKALPILLHGLKTLEYRGYDSAGIAYLDNSKITTVKSVGKISLLKEKVDMDITTNIGIGHTRWATHGGVTVNNCHPHIQGDIVLVHNGIIENYLEIKEKLIKFGYKFVGETDSEVLCGLIDYYYKQNKDILKALTKVIKDIKGSYACAIMINGESKNIYTIKKDSPLIIGVSLDENFVASDVPAILKYTNKYMYLSDGEIACVSSGEVKVYNELGEVNKEIHKFDNNDEVISLHGYSHYMLKEIYEQAILARNNLYDNLNDIPDISKYNNIYIVACGSAYHAGLIGRNLLEKYVNKPVVVELASEFRYKKLFLTDKDLVIVISQSGETADTLASLRIAKLMGSTVMGIVNVVGSSIAREVDFVVYTNAKTEIAVATTKGYMMQVYVLGLIAIKNSNIDYDQVYDDYKLFANQLDGILDSNIYYEIAKEIFNHKDIFFLGRGIDYSISLEGSLKLKEISYIHSEAYAAGELKHGTISLIEEGTPVISIITDNSIKDKTLSNIKEVISRGAKSYIVATEDIEIDESYYHKLIRVPNSIDTLKPLLAIVPLQLISYEVAKLNGCDIDKPRNLAKSVTVE